MGLDCSSLNKYEYRFHQSSVSEVKHSQSANVLEKNTVRASENNVFVTQAFAFHSS